MFMYLFAVVILNAHAELNVFQYPSGNLNEMRLLSLSLASVFFVRMDWKFDLCSSGENNGR
jgi:hypothetical protein